MGPRTIIRLDATDSTNAVALERGVKGAAAGTVITATMQTAGRGRMNRCWLSPPGMGLYFSIILRPQLEPEQLAKITLASGLALCRVVEAEYAVFPQIKWPNDLLLHGRKFGGILTETGPLGHISEGELPLVIVGVGLNLNPPAGGFPPELQDRATSLASHVGRKIAAEIILEAGAAAIEQVVVRLERGDFPTILAEWKERDATLGKRLTWVTVQGRQVHGVSLGPDADGILHIRDRSGTIHTVISGDVNLAGNVPG